MIVSYRGGVYILYSEWLRGTRKKKENKEIKNHTKSMHGVVMSKHSSSHGVLVSYLRPKKPWKRVNLFVSSALVNMSATLS